VGTCRLASPHQPFNPGFRRVMQITRICDTAD
jgi:hypothetical protein